MQFSPTFQTSSSTSTRTSRRQVEVRSYSLRRQQRWALVAISHHRMSSWRTFCWGCVLVTPWRWMGRQTRVLPPRHHHHHRHRRPYRHRHRPPRLRPRRLQWGTGGHENQEVRIWGSQAAPKEFKKACQSLSRDNPHNALTVAHLAVFLVTRHIL